MGKLLHNDKQRNCEDTLEKRKRSFICAFSICMTVPLTWNLKSTTLKNLQLINIISKML